MLLFSISFMEFINIEQKHYSLISITPLTFLILIDTIIFQIDILVD